MLKLIHFSLKKGGFHLFEGRNGQQAIDLALSVKPDLIVMDLMMPVLDGMEALAELKKNPETAEIPVIMLTAKGHVLTRGEAEACGAAKFLTKPFSPTSLLQEVCKHLKTNPEVGSWMV